MLTKERHREYNLQYYHNRRNKLIQQLGGKCVMCGSTENLEFDHINSKEKTFSVGSRIQNNNSEFSAELDKCQLLCHSCHRKKSKDSKDIKVKINKETAVKICEEYFNSDISQADLGKRYNLAPRTISSIVTGERWSEETAGVDRSMLKEKRSATSIKSPVAVDMLDPVTGAVIKTYRSISEATKDGHTGSSIVDCYKGRKNTHHGFVWREHK